tara:strand:- start:134 stop:451 length:318 start_codon:yes stop_codon:yes gene_type:complete
MMTPLQQTLLLFPAQPQRVRAGQLLEHRLEHMMAVVMVVDMAAVQVAILAMVVKVQQVVVHQELREVVEQVEGLLGPPLGFLEGVELVFTVREPVVLRVLRVEVV